jgi:uncharacterized protein
MTTDHHGAPCWYELTTGDLDAAQTFYADLFDWSWANAGMSGFDYRLASLGGSMIAGASTGAQPDTPPGWLTYFAVTDCDAAAKAVADSGGAVHMPPADIPGTGRFAILADPQGAAFGILQPLPMPDGSIGGAFDQQKMGHGNWHELMTTDPKAAMDFYKRVFGWTVTSSMDMGPMGSYDMFAHQGADIGGMMGLPPHVPRPMWLAVFGKAGVVNAAEAIKAARGGVLRGPTEIPGGAHSLTATDPQGAMFALVGPA